MSGLSLDASRRTTRVLRAFCLLLVAAYAAMMLLPANLALQDLPNHVARAVIMSEILFGHGATFSEWFHIHWTPIPYILGDLLLVALVEVLGPDWGGKVWAAAALLSIPAATVVFLRGMGIRGDAIFVSVPILLWMSTNWFFLSGFLHFQFAVAAAIATILVGHRYLREGRPGALVAWIALLVASYLLHFAAFVFTIAGMTAVGLLCLLEAPRATLMRGVWLALPAAGVAAWQLGTSHLLEEAVSGNYLVSKFGPRKLLYPFLRYDKGADFGIVLLFAGTFVVALVGMDRACWATALRDKRVQLSAALAFTFLLLYVLMPARSPGMAHIDVRALLPAALFALMCVLAILDRARPSRFLPSWLAVAALVLAAGNLTLVGGRLMVFDAAFADYREAAARIRPESIVLPVLTREQVGAVHAYAHVQAYALIEARSLTPYLFSWPEMAPHMRYFESRVSLPAGRRHDQWWYVSGQPAPSSAPEIADAYDYVIATRPFDPARLGIRYRLVYENDSAVLIQPIKDSEAG